MTKVAPPKVGSTYGPSVNYGSFSIVGTIAAVTSNGLVVQTSQNNLVGIFVNRDSVLASPTGKKFSLSDLQKGNVVSIVARVNPGGQFVALRLIQE